jgi:hypothetical protein
LILSFVIAIALLVPGAAYSQVFVTGLGGAAALSNAASASANPISSANYNAFVGPAFNVAAGYHLNDWFSVQAFYIWNRNRVVTTQVASASFQQLESTRRQDAVGTDALLYFRPRRSRIRPYLSGGPAWVRVLSQNKMGFRTAVGVDVAMSHGWQLRYTFSEMMTANPIAQSLNPPTKGLLMNYQNLVGFVKTF